LSGHDGGGGASRVDSCPRCRLTHALAPRAAGDHRRQRFRPTLGSRGLRGPHRPGRASIPQAHPVRRTTSTPGPRQRPCSPTGWCRRHGMPPGVVPVVTVCHPVVCCAATCSSCPSTRPPLGSAWDGSVEVELIALQADHFVGTSEHQLGQALEDPRRGPLVGPRTAVSEATPRRVARHRPSHSRSSGGPGWPKGDRVSEGVVGVDEVTATGCQLLSERCAGSARSALSGRGLQCQNSFGLAQRVMAGSSEQRASIGRLGRVGCIVRSDGVPASADWSEYELGGQT